MYSSPVFKTTVSIFYSGGDSYDSVYVFSLGVIVIKAEFVIDFSIYYQAARQSDHKPRKYQKIRFIIS